MVGQEGGAGGSTVQSLMNRWEKSRWGDSEPWIWLERVMCRRNAIKLNYKWGYRGEGGSYKRVTRELPIKWPGSTNCVCYALLYNESFTTNCYWRLKAACVRDCISTKSFWFIKMSFACMFVIVKHICVMHICRTYTWLGISAVTRNLSESLTSLSGRNI